jgi:hypothetical protein
VIQSCCPVEFDSSVVQLWFCDVIANSNCNSAVSTTLSEVSQCPWHFWVWFWCAMIPLSVLHSVHDTSEYDSTGSMTPLNVIPKIDISECDPAVSMIPLNVIPQSLWCLSVWFSSVSGTPAFNSTVSMTFRVWKSVHDTSECDSAMSMNSSECDSAGWPLCCDSAVMSMTPLRVIPQCSWHLSVLFHYVVGTYKVWLHSVSMTLNMGSAVSMIPPIVTLCTML